MSIIDSIIMLMNRQGKKQKELTDYLGIDKSTFSQWKNGNTWGNRNVEYLLTNPVYIGKLRRSQDPCDRSDRFHENAELVDGAHEPIVTAGVFEQAQARRAALKKQYGRYARQAPAEFMLKGLCRCSSCGATLVAAQGGKYLQCHNYARGQCAVSHCISTTKITAAVLDRLQTDLDGGVLTIDLTTAEKQRPSEIGALTQAISREEKKLERVRGRIRSGLGTLTRDDVSETTKNEVLRGFVERVILMKPKGNIEIRYKGDFL